MRISDWSSDVCSSDLLAGLSADEGRNRFPNLPGVDVSALLSSPSAPTERDKRGHFFNYAVAHMWEPNSAKVVGPRPPGESIPDYSKIYDLEKRRLHRGVHDGRWKFARYFAPAHHHTPREDRKSTRLNSSH